MNRSLVFLLCIAVGLGSLLLTATRLAAGPPAQWHQWNRASFSTNRSDFAKRMVSITPTDMLVQYWNEGVAGEPDGRLLLTKHRFLAVRGLHVEPNQGITPLINALVDYLLIVRMLELGFPGGPASLKEDQEFSTHEAKKPIHISVPGARVLFPAPWRIDGQIRTLQSDSLSYRLQLIVGARATEKETFEGTLEFVPELASEFSSEMSLEGWTAYRIEEVQTIHLGNQGVEYWAVELPNMATLGELRANSE